ncbi:hypothetical protein JOE68_003041 [Saccharothrix algeriensis]|uniref:Uncharacterized protein n=1 Tax=Saccharothrix algeriensis TaxID=173560 RepID=A0ABS2S7E7_9PSEU|nr:hypothetical protein [Saccharothrix algeriensis]
MRQARRQPARHRGADGDGIAGAGGGAEVAARAVAWAVA